MGTCQEGAFSGPTQTYWIRTSGGWSPAICVFLTFGHFNQVTQLFRDRKMLRTIDQGEEFQLGREAGTQTWRQDDEAGLSGKPWESKAPRRQHTQLAGKDGPGLAHSQHSLVSFHGQNLRPRLVLLDPAYLHHLITLKSAGNKGCDYLKTLMLYLGAYKAFNHDEMWVLLLQALGGRPFVLQFYFYSN